MTPVNITLVKEGVTQLSVRNKCVTSKEDEILERLDIINRNIACIRFDIAPIVKETVLQVLKERRKYVEVGYDNLIFLRYFSFLLI